MWGLYGENGIDVEGAWNIVGNGGEKVRVGIIDTGIGEVAESVDENGQAYITHPYLNSQIARDEDGKMLGGDFYNMSSTLEPGPLKSDTDGHGTHVAGIVGAALNSQNGMVGVAKNVELVPLQVIKDNGYLDVGAITRAITYAINNDVDILNYSGGGSTNDGDRQTAIENFNGLFVCCAGNDVLNTDETPQYPSVYSDETNASYTSFSSKVISVGAITSSGELWDDSTAERVKGSNYGAETVSLFAPGKNILSTYKNNGYAYYNGTSMATPFVTGVAALMLSANPNLSAAEIKDIIMDNVDEVAALSGKCVTGGILNAYESVLDAIYETTVTSTGGVIIDGLRNNLTLSGAVEIPEKFNGKNVTEIGASAFSGCTGLTSVTIPNTVTRIGQNAFYNTGIWNSTNIGSVVYVDNWAVGYKTDALAITTEINNLIIEEGTVGIADYAFSGILDALINSPPIYAIIPNGVQYIGEYAFSVGGDCTIYTEYSSKQTGWDTNWNVDIGLVTDEYQPVIYEVTLSDDNTYVTELYKSTGSITNPSGREIVDTAQSGYIVGAWFNNSAYTGTAYTTEQLISAPSGRYYARWVEEEITITYRDVGGLGSSFSGYFDGEYPTTHRYGEVTELDTPNAIGATFVGWYINSDGSGEAITELSAYGYTEDITLYAKWESMILMDEEETETQSEEESNQEETFNATEQAYKLSMFPKRYTEVYLSKIKHFGYCV